MRIAVARETDDAEPRVAATPETAKKLQGLGAEVVVEPGAGIKSGILDADYTAAGAAVSGDALNGADVVLQVRRPEGAELSRLKKGAMPVARSRNSRPNASAAGPRKVQQPQPKSCPGLAAEKRTA